MASNLTKNPQYLKIVSTALTYKQKLDYPLIHDISGGSYTMRLARETYLPREWQEPDDKYNARLKRSVLFPFFEKNTNVSLSLITTSPISLPEDIDPRIDKDLDNIDLMGNDLDCFIKTVLEDCLTFGIGYVMCDFPNPGENPMDKETQTVKTLDDYLKQNLRPYWYRIPPEDIWSYTTVINGGIAMLGSLTVLERHIVNQTEQNWYRQYEPGKSILYTPYEEPIETPNDFKFIPLVPFYAKRKGFLYSPPPFKELAQMCVAHYQQYSDYCNKQHITNVPMLILTGLDNRQVQEGVVMKSGEGLAFGPDGDAKWLESPTGGYDSSLNQLQHLQENIKETMITPALAQKAAAETEASKKIDAAHKISFLRSLLKGAEDSINQLLVYHADFYGIGYEQAPEVEIEDTLIESKLTKEEIGVVFQACSAGKLSTETFLEILKLNDFCPEDFDISAELERLAAENLQNLDQMAMETAALQPPIPDPQNEG